MTNTDAANILGISGTLNADSIKDAFRKAAMMYHPDRNAAGLEMMKMVNEAYETLKDFAGPIAPDQSQPGYGVAVNDFLNSIIDLAGLDIEVCGSWVWVGGETKEHKATLKANRARWASKKLKWYFRPEGWKSKSRGRWSMDQIRNNYGSEKINRPEREALAA